jgi:hypothetical protein
MIIDSTRWTRSPFFTALLVVAAWACFIGIVVLRQGPPPGGDTVPLTAVTSELASGNLRAAAAIDSLPNLPGYPLLASPLVAAFPSLVGSPTWCRPAPAGPERTLVDTPGWCGFGSGSSEGVAAHTLPPWYRAQGLLGLLTWLVLATGCLALLGVAGADTLSRRAGLLLFLAFLPAASSAIVQLFHPQDILSLGLSIWGVALALRRRWVLAGAIFGVAFLSKQFAVLVFLPALVVAPDFRSRLRLAAPAGAVVAAGLLPFLVVDPRTTFDNLSGFSAGGALAGSTVLTLLGVTGNAGSAVARDAPVLFAVAVCLWAAHRFGRSMARAEPLVALALACVGSRLVFESVIFPYYLLAASVLFFMLDMVGRRSPSGSLAWTAAAAFFVALHPTNRTVDAFGTLGFAVIATGAGLAVLLTKGASVKDSSSLPASDPAED